ncbi:MAG TPA: hypothetical protein VI583_10735 [Cyclobacteriaceae bacterium]|nr:hypothetical protein [Cyclobacteriaceae bacterium]
MGTTLFEWTAKVAKNNKWGDYDSIFIAEPSGRAITGGISKIKNLTPLHPFKS